MRTKGIRQAEDESPYTVKTKGAAWWKEEDNTHSHSAAGIKQTVPVKSIITVLFLEAEPRSDQASFYTAQSSIPLPPAATQSAKTTGPFAFSNDS